LPLPNHLTVESGEKKLLSSAALFGLPPKMKRCASSSLASWGRRRLKDAPTTC
jgi:hypothetical protein